MIVLETSAITMTRSHLSSHSSYKVRHDLEKPHLVTPSAAGVPENEIPRRDRAAESQRPTVALLQRGILSGLQPVGFSHKYWIRFLEGSHQEAYRIG
jgi:hypothetical protein